MNDIKLIYINLKYIKNYYHVEKSTILKVLMNYFI